MSFFSTNEGNYFGNNIGFPVEDALQFQSQLLLAQANDGLVTLSDGTTEASFEVWYFDFSPNEFSPNSALLYLEPVGVEGFVEGALIQDAFGYVPSGGIEITIAYSPYDCITQENIHEAVALWLTNEAEAAATYGPISDWDVSQVTDMARLFSQELHLVADGYDEPIPQIADFNADITGWDVSHVTNMYRMFFGASAFNQNISTWDMSSAQSIHMMFDSASAFDQPIGNWDVSQVSDMHRLFKATTFNQDLSAWNTSNVTDMFGMFTISQFNLDISSWDVSSVTNMGQMFYGASAFDQDISAWNVSSVTRMEFMFYNGSLANFNLGGWDISNVTDMQAMFNGSNLTTSEYDQILVAWSSQSVQPDVLLGASATSWCSDAAGSARDALIANGWTINDGDRDPSCKNLGCTDPTACDYDASATTVLFGSVQAISPFAIANGYSLNYFGADLALIQSMETHLEPGMTLVVNGQTHLLDAIDYPNNVNLGLAILYVADAGNADGNPWSIGGELDATVWAGDSWSIDLGNALCTYPDQCGICGGNNACVGCMDPAACNFDESSTIPAPDCNYAPAGLTCDCLTEVAYEGELSGTESAVVTLENHVGALDKISVVLHFDNPNSVWSYPADLLLRVDAPDGGCFEVGGYDVDATCSNTGSYGPEWAGESPGTYSAEIEVPESIGGVGEWTFSFTNGYVVSGSVSYDVSLSCSFLCENDVPGCMDASACNYDEDATVDDGSCTYPGCMNSDACNYSADAACDDGSCEFAENLIYSDFEHTAGGNGNGNGNAGGNGNGNSGGSNGYTNGYGSSQVFWSIWNDGGSDCRLAGADAGFATSGTRCVRLRDNSSTSHMVTDNLAFDDFGRVDVTFNFVAASMESGESFHLEYSLDGGANFVQAATYVSGVDFANGVTEWGWSEGIVADFTDETQFRFRCDASNNQDYIYLDDIYIQGCGGAEDLRFEEELGAPVALDLAKLAGRIYPNPATGLLQIEWKMEGWDGQAELMILDYTGRIALQSQLPMTQQVPHSYDITGLTRGLYVVQILAGDARWTEQLIIQ